MTHKKTMPAPNSDNAVWFPVVPALHHGEESREVWSSAGHHPVLVLLKGSQNVRAEHLVTKRPKKTTKFSRSNQIGDIQPTRMWILAQLHNPTAKGSSKVPRLFRFFGACIFVLPVPCPRDWNPTDSLLGTILYGRYIYTNGIYRPLSITGGTSYKSAQYWTMGLKMGPPSSWYLKSFTYH